jgi:hypothetical protein
MGPISNGQFYRYKMVQTRKNGMIFKWQKQDGGQK